MNPNRLFLASCVSLIATAMSFAIRGDIMGDFQEVHVKPYVAELAADASNDGVDPIKQRLGVISGAAFFSFGLAILFGGPLCDLLGMGLLLRLAAFCHIGGALWKRSRRSRLQSPDRNALPGPKNEEAHSLPRLVPWRHRNRRTPVLRLKPDGFRHRVRHGMEN